VLRTCAHTAVGDSSTSRSDTDNSTTATGDIADHSAGVDGASSAAATATTGRGITGAVHSSATTATASATTSTTDTVDTDYSSKTSALTAELAFTQQWLSTHVSDHSALKHRAVVVRLAAAAATSTNTALQLLHKELQHSKQMLLQHPGHESLWCYRRFAFQAAVLLLAPTVSYSELCDDFVHSWDRWASVTANSIACSCTG
jgi:Protein prenyltransferase alpha subunit repeat